MSLHWIDDADQYICPICRFETYNPYKLEECRCPKCGFQDPKDAIKKKDVRMRLVDGDALKEKAFGKRGGLIHTADIDEMPTIEERKTGKWIEIEVFSESYDIYGDKTWSSKMQCDQCGFRHTAIEGHMAQYNFCPNCGADMRGDSNDRQM